MKGKKAGKRRNGTRKASRPVKLRRVLTKKTKAPPTRAVTPAKATPAPKASTPAPPPGASGDVAKRMAAFSAKVLKEEEDAVAVRSWGEAKAGLKASKSYLPKTGAVTPAASPEPGVEDEDSEIGDEGRQHEHASKEEFDESEEGEGDRAPEIRREPRPEPLAGKMAVPNDQPLEFDVDMDRKSRGKKKGRRGVRPEEFGLVELRQATATGGKHLTRSKPENLQRGATRIQPLATPEPGREKKRRDETFEVSAPTRPGLRAADLMEFGEVEIGQQTLSGSRKVGNLESPERKKKKDADDE